MIFGTGQQLALTVIREKTNLVELGTGQDERSISTCSFDLTLLQDQCLKNPSEEQFGALFAIVVQVILPRPSFLRQLLRREDPSADLLVEIREEATSESGCYHGIL